MRRNNDQFGFNFDVKFEAPMLDEEKEAPAFIEEEVEKTPEQSHVELEENGQIPLINIGEWWEEHWKQMPEFAQEDLKPWKSIYVHFENRADMEAFEKLVGQRINLTTKFIWYPEATISRYIRTNRRYEDSN
jgi:hypothetical protein